MTSEREHLDGVIDDYARKVGAKVRLVTGRDLLPCPFCGGRNLASPPGIAAIVCGDCHACGPVGVAHPTVDALTHAAGKAKWNARVAAKEGA